MSPQLARGRDTRMAAITENLEPRVGVFSTAPLDPK
jgi:hypothetical protein